MADEINTGSSPDLSSVLSELLTNKELMEKISEIASSIEIPEKAEPKQSLTEIGALLSDPNMLSRLPDVINVIKPLISDQGSGSSPHNSKQLALLMALKPYMSPKRCEAIDYIAKISKLSQGFRGLKL